MKPEEQVDELRIRLNGETARIRWAELGRQFAAGRAIRVSRELDLVEVAAAVAEDDSARVHAWLAADGMAAVSDQEARTWLQRDARVWAVVVKPYVLVQEADADP